MAAHFKFRLASVLKLRHSLEEEAQRNLARAIAQEEACRARLSELHSTHAATVEGRRVADSRVVDLELWRATERYLLVLEKRMQQTKAEISEAQAQVTLARAALLKAHQDHLMLVRLKERRLEQHNLEASRQEAREADEIAVLRHRINHVEVTP